MAPAPLPGLGCSSTSSSTAVAKPCAQRSWRSRGHPRVPSTWLSLGVHSQRQRLQALPRLAAASLGQPSATVSGRAASPVASVALAASTPATVGNGTWQEQQVVQNQPATTARPPAADAAEPAATGGGSNGCGGASWEGGDGRGGGGDDGSGSGFDPIGILLRGLRGRLEADPDFGYKLLVELGLDAVIIVSVNAASRGDRFLKELEFTLCQLAVSLSSGFALVYLLAPSIYRPLVVAGTWRAATAALPAHVFQRSPPGGPAFTPVQRVGTLALKAVQYGALGLAMGVLGTATVHGLIGLRERVDPGFTPPARVQSIGGVAALWGAFMATNSNVRYNAVNLVEDLLFARSAALGKAGSVVLRLANNWVGAAQWVSWTQRADITRPWHPVEEAQKERDET